jgi:DNA repair protein SbcD/Mre11
VTENLAQGYPAPRAGLFNIGLLHTSADGRPGHDAYAPCDLSDLVLKGYDYWALGHVHTREVLATDPFVVFPGNLQSRHVNEPGAKGFSLVTVEGGRVRGVEHVPVDAVRWATVAVDVSGTAALEDLCPRIGRAIARAVADAGGLTLAVRLVLRGTCAAHRALAGDPERLAAECASLAIQSGADVWIERVEVETEEEALQADAAALADVRELIGRVRADPAEVDRIRAALERGLDKVPLPLRAEAGLAGLPAERCARILADAEAMILHRLSA